MKRFAVLSLFVVLAFASGTLDRYHKGNLLIENIPDIPYSLIERLIPYQNVRSATLLDWLPGNRGMLIRTRFGNVNQIHYVEIPKGARQQLTFFTEPVGYGIVCPDSAIPFFLFTKDSAGNEVDQIYAYNYRTATYSMLTDGKSKHDALVWSRRGTTFAFASTMRNGKDYDIYIGTLQGKESFTCLVEEGGYWNPLDFSPDDKNLIVEKYVSAHQSHYYILNIESKRLSEINPTSGTISYGGAQWSRDGKGIFMISDQESEYKQLLYYDLETKTFTILTKSILWDIVEFETSPLSDTIAFTSNEDGYTMLYFLNTKTKAITQARLPRGQVYGLRFKPRSDELGFVINTPAAPGDVYSLNLKNRRLIRWTYSEVAGLDTAHIVLPQLIHYPTFDSSGGEPRIIPAFYYKPERYNPPYPVLITCHGGPEEQYVPYFSANTQFYLKEMGVAVIVPNIRGSSGYGKTYGTLDDWLKREDAVQDIGALLDWINQQPELDTSRVGITGGSYGGYLVLASLVHYNDKLRCGIDEWGISNFVTFLENTGSYRRDLRRQEYGDERDPTMRAFLQRISPLSSANNIRKPLFIVQGLHDPRVPVTEAEQIRDAVRRNNVDVWYLLAEDEGHGFGKKTNWEYSQAAKILFLQNFLLK